MATGAIAALVAALALGFAEGLGRFYPSRQTWRRLRRARGRKAVRRMRERFEQASKRKTSRRLALALVVLVVAWVAAASLLDKRWYEVLLDVTPYVIVLVALLRVPPLLDSVAERMKEYEREVGEEPDEDEEASASYWPD